MTTAIFFDDADVDDGKIMMMVIFFLIRKFIHNTPL